MLRKETGFQYLVCFNNKFSFASAFSLWGMLLLVWLSVPNWNAGNQRFLYTFVYSLYVSGPIMVLHAFHVAKHEKLYQFFEISQALPQDHDRRYLGRILGTMLFYITLFIGIMLTILLIHLITRTPAPSLSDCVASFLGIQLPFIIFATAMGFLLNEFVQKQIPAWLIVIGGFIFLLVLGEKTHGRPTPWFRLTLLDPIWHMYDLGGEGLGYTFPGYAQDLPLLGKSKLFWLCASCLSLLGCISHSRKKGHYPHTVLKSVVVTTLLGAFLVGTVASGALFLGEIETIEQIIKKSEEKYFVDSQVNLAFRENWIIQHHLQIQDYALDIELEPRRHTLRAVAKITLENLSDQSYTSIPFSLDPDLTIHYIKQNGQEISWTQDRTINTVGLVQSLQPGSRVELEIGYSGIIWDWKRIYLVAELKNFIGEATLLNDTYGWYPLLGNHFYYLFNSSIRENALDSSRPMILPHPLTLSVIGPKDMVIATGLPLVSEEFVENKRHTVFSGTAIAALSLVGSRNFVRISEGNITWYLFPEDREKRLPLLSEYQKQLEFYSMLTGWKPEQFTLITVPLGLNGRKLASSGGNTHLVSRRSELHFANDVVVKQAFVRYHGVQFNVGPHNMRIINRERFEQLFEHVKFPGLNRERLAATSGVHGNTSTTLGEYLDFLYFVDTGQKTIADIEDEFYFDPRLLGPSAESNVLEPLKTNVPTSVQMLHQVYLDHGIEGVARITRPLFELTSGWGASQPLIEMMIITAFGEDYL
ncbi:MAG: hypothetical protein M0Q40_01355 [Limnochordia bacterium]|nr:hypothetical protein [Limnochordia bacterium]